MTHEIRSHRRIFVEAYLYFGGVPKYLDQEGFDRFGQSVAISGNRGRYEVYVTWAPFSNRATNAPYKVYDGPAVGGVLEGTFAIDQDLPN